MKTESGCYTVKKEELLVLLYEFFFPDKIFHCFAVSNPQHQFEYRLRKLTTETEDLEKKEEST